MYEVKIRMDADDIYNKLSISEREKFDKVVITDVKKDNNEIIITGIVTEKKVTNNKRL